MKRRSSPVPEAMTVLLDQNVPREIGPWLSKQRPSWRVLHTSQVELSLASDRDIFVWAQQMRALVVTFDEDFADVRFLPGGSHCGVIRLRVWPTTVEETERALARLLEQVADDEMAGALIIIDRFRIRIRKPRS